MADPVNEDAAAPVDDVLPDVLADTRDALIARLDGAVKFQPILEAMLAEELDKLPLAEVAGKDAGAVEALAADAVDKRQDEALAIAQAGHARFLAALRKELADDPDARGYAAMSADQVADEMTRQIEVEEDVAILDRDGNPTGKTRKAVTRVRPAPCWRVIRGIPYGRNVVRAKEIEEARA